MILAALGIFDSIARAQQLIERNPTSFVAAAGWIAAAGIFFLYVRTRDRKLTRITDMQRQHELEMNRLHQSYVDRLEKVHIDERHRAIQAEKTMVSLVETLQTMKQLLMARERQRAPRPRPPPERPE